MFLRLAPRAATEPAGVAELVELCGRLPLAISLLARLFSTRRSWTLGQLIDETKTTLLTVTADNRTAAAAFDLSYQYLPADRQRFFRSLGLHPGVDIDAYAAAALTGLPLDQATEHLDALYSDHLLDEPVYRRYRMHDLIRDYARTLATTDERDQALGRLLDFYQHTADHAEARLTRQTRPAATTSAVSPVVSPVLANRSQALAWVRTERANLLTCLEHVSDHAQHARVVGLTAGVVSLLRSDGPWTQAVGLHTQAAAAARHLGDRLGEANALTVLGRVRDLTGNWSGAAEVLEQALGLYRDFGDRLGEANALTYLGVVWGLTGDFAGAAEVLEQALGLHRNLGDRLGEANAVSYLGTVRWLTGDYAGAAEVLEQALSLYRDLGSQLGEAEALNQSGMLSLKSGDLEQALAHYQRALDLARAVDSPLGKHSARGLTWADVLLSAC